MSESLPCIVCDADLADAFPDPPQGNQPSDGVEFVARGAYGSTIFDPMDGTKLIVNICDTCIGKAAKDGVVRQRIAQPTRTTKDTPWPTAD